MKLPLPTIKIRQLEELKRLTHREAQHSAELAQLTGENEKLRADIGKLSSDIEKLRADLEEARLDAVAHGKRLDWGLDEGRKTSLALFERVESLRKTQA